MFGSSESWGPQQHPHPWHFRAGGGAVHSIKSGREQSQQGSPLFDLLLFEMCIAQAIDLYSGKSRGQREQRDGLQPVMRRSAEQRIADRGGDEYAVLLAPQELSRCTLQLRRNPDVPAVKKRTERVERSTVQPDADRAAELFLMPNCFPAPGQTLRPCNRLRGLGERHAIGISEIEAHGSAKFLRAATS